MTAFDTAVQTWVVHIAASSFVFTHTVHAIADFNFTKGVVPLAILCAMWFQPGEAQQWRCEDQAANCLGRCVDRAGGAGDWGGHQSKCLRCDWRLIKCVRNATIRLTRYSTAP